MVVAYRFDRNDVIHRDLMISSIQDENNKIFNKYAYRLELHTNINAKQLLDNLRDTKSLKGLIPYDLI